jgi:probable HAF family extracellular repeat protein
MSILRTLARLATGPLAATIAAAAPYSVVDLGTFTNPAGQSEARPNALNRTGVIAAANASGGVYQALVYDGNWLNLGTLGGSAAYATGINDSQRVVGYATLADGSRRAFLWTPGSPDGVPGNPQMKDLGTLGGGASEAYAINNAGQITGYSQTSERNRAFRYSGGVMTDLGVLLSGAQHSYGFDINESGRVAGIAYNNSYSTSTAFYYNGSSILELPGRGGGNSSALAISDTDRIAGYAATGDGFERAFRYHAGVMTDLGTLGGKYSYGVGINNSNAVVGGAFVDLNNTLYRAFLATGDTMIDLNTQLDATGAGWTLIEVRAINDAGQIVGVGRRNNTTRGFLLRPILPAPPAPTITGLKFEGDDVLLSFTTVATASYSVEIRGQFGPGEWSELIQDLPGSGGVVTATNAGGASLTNQFYRIKAATP